MPNNPGETVAFRVTHVGSGLQWWVDAPFEAPEDPGVWVARLVSGQICRVWNEPVVHAGDCPIIPIADYDIQAIDCICDPSIESNYSAALRLPTIPQPDPAVPKWWTDVVGAKVALWTPPDKVVNMDDIMAAVQKFQKVPDAPHITWMDVDPEVPNVILNFTDIQVIVLGFKGNPYPYSAPEDCATIARLGGYSNSGCLPGPGKGPARDYPWCGEDVVEFRVEPGTLHVLHRDAEYWCAQADIEISLTVEGNILRMIEKEIDPEPTDCRCCYNVEATIVDLAPGSYTAELCWDEYGEGQACYAEEVEIP